MRRRRRRSSFAKAHPERRWILLGVGAVALVGAFVFFLHQADVLAPEPTTISVELPDVVQH